MDTIYLQYIIGIISVLFVISLTIAIINSIKISNLTKKYNSFMKALSKKDIEQLLMDNMELSQKVLKENEMNKNQIEEMRDVFKSCFQKYGIVRYTAFEDVGSDLSFAIALLDAKDDGFIINGIYSREGSSVYAKSVHKGETRQNLSEEEQKALERAQRRGKEY